MRVPITRFGGTGGKVTDDRRFGLLMKAAQGGDTDAYAQLMQELVPRLRQIVHRHRGFLGQAAVEDLVQDVLLSVHAVRATYDPSRDFVPWLLAITKHRLADGARRDARRVAHEVSVEDLAVTFSDESANTTSEVYGDPEALRQAIQELPPRERTAIEMLKLREMSLKEVAAATGTSIGSLKVATYRAMNTLRKRLT